MFYFIKNEHKCNLLKSIEIDIFRKLSILQRMEKTAMLEFEAQLQELKSSFNYHRYSRKVFYFVFEFEAGLLLDDLILDFKKLDEKMTTKIRLLEAQNYIQKTRSQKQSKKTTPSSKNDIQSSDFVDAAIEEIQNKTGQFDVINDTLMPNKNDALPILIVPLASILLNNTDIELAAPSQSSSNTECAETISKTQESITTCDAFNSSSFDSGSSSF